MVSGENDRQRERIVKTFCVQQVDFFFHVALGGSDGGASVFSQRSAASKSTGATGKSGSAIGGNVTLATGNSGVSGIPRAAIEGSAFVIPAQEVF